MPHTTDRYTGKDYLAANPDWHVADSPWKADRVMAVLGTAQPRTVCEVGCGAGEVLRQLHDRLPGTRFTGYEIAEQPVAMAAGRATERLAFLLKDAAQDPQRFDLMLILDVIEHVPDPIGFLRDLRFKADRVILHVPLDLSVQSICRPNKLLDVRHRVGHIHYFTMETAVATIVDAGYEVLSTTLTRPFDLPQSSVKARAARIPRRFLPPALTVRLLGGYSLMIDASRADASGRRNA